MASWALSEIASNRSEHSPTQNRNFSTTQHHSYLSSQIDQDDLTRHESNTSSRPEAIQEVPEPTSSQSSDSSRMSHGQSALTKLIRNTPPTDEDILEIEEDLHATAGLYPVTVREGIISQPSERTTLGSKRTAYGSIKDLEGQQVAGAKPENRMKAVCQRSREGTVRIVRAVSNLKSWDRRDVLEYGVRQPASFVPPVLLGLLLNILDALSYGDPQELRYRSN